MAASDPETVNNPTRVRSTRTPTTRLARRSPPMARISRPSLVQPRMAAAMN
jgi:hypothetical protein